MNSQSTSKESLKNWWWFVVKGILFLITGIVVSFKPVEGYVGLSILFSALILSSGVSQLAFALNNRNALPGWGWTFVSGIIDIAIGTYLLAFPIVSITTLPFFLGFWLLFRAFYLMGTSFDLKAARVSGWGWLLGGSILLLLISLLILSDPVLGVLWIIFSLSAGFMIGGILNILLALKFRTLS